MCSNNSNVTFTRFVVQIYFHGKNLSSLHSYVDQAILPAEYGGQQTEFDNTRWRQELIHLEDEFAGTLPSSRYHYMT